MNSAIHEPDQEVEQLYASLNAPRPVLVVLSGPSGVGKDSIICGLKKSNYPFHFVVTATTRPRRPAEVDGVDYYFVSVGEFAEMIENEELLEYAVVYGDYKGIPKKHVREALLSGQDVVMRIDVQGAATIRALVPSAVTIFLTAESEEKLVRRLLQRKTEEADQLKMRVVTARRELRRFTEFDYIVINREEQLETAVQEVLCIIRAEKSRVDLVPFAL